MSTGPQEAHLHGGPYGGQTQMLPGASPPLRLPTDLTAGAYILDEDTTRACQRPPYLCYTWVQAT
jgi:hypothetical protein